MYIYIYVCMFMNALTQDSFSIVFDMNESNELIHR
jgi:hypothetical protein